jgi:hypothetical protein
MTADAAATILITKEEILIRDVSHVRSILDSFIPTLVERNRNGVEILITDYDDDERELFLIPEVRPWFHRLFDVIPDLFFWMDMSNGRLLLYALMMRSPVRVEGGTTIIPEDMQEFLTWGFSHLNVFCKMHDFDPEPSNQHINTCIKESIG